MKLPPGQSSLNDRTHRFLCVVAQDSFVHSLTNQGVGSSIRVHMGAGMSVKLPSELDAFIQNGEGTFHCEDGDWDLAIIPGEKSEFSKELPKGALMIAENGSGDCLFLKGSAGGKVGGKVFVYWHEEGRSEVFAPSLEKLIAISSEPKKQAAEPPSSSKQVSLAELEKAFGKREGLYEKLKAFKAGTFGAEALPLLRRALVQDNVQVATEAAECIAKLGTAARAAGADRLETELFVIGSKVWSYSLYCNCYSACLDALQKIEADEDLLMDYLGHSLAGLSEDDLLETLKVLQEIGTKEAKSLFKRAVTYREPELNLRYRKEIEKMQKAGR